MGFMALIIIGILRLNLRLIQRCPVLTTAINNVNAQRATFGSTVNRLGYAIDNLANVSLNAEASRSRVQDADYAQETSQLARTQIIQQAGTAMLAQANALPQTVLALLK